MCIPGIQPSREQQMPSPVGRSFVRPFVRLSGWLVFIIWIAKERELLNDDKSFCWFKPRIAVCFESWNLESGPELISSCISLTVTSFKTDCSFGVSGALPRRLFDGISSLVIASSWEFLRFGGNRRHFESNHQPARFHELSFLMSSHPSRMNGEEELLQPKSGVCSDRHRDWVWVQL